MIGSRLRQGSCRLCLWESNSLWDIFGELAERRNFVRKIQACVNIIVSKDDGLSSLICPNCIYKIELFYDFQTSCKRSDEIQKRYNGLQDVELGDCDAEEDVLPAMELRCGISNSHKDTEGRVEMIDIKEEPIDDDEVTIDGVDDGQFEDAEVQIEEVVPVTEARLEEEITATEHQQQEEEKRTKEKECEGVDNGSCLQLTPPRSPSFASDVTCTVSEAGGSAGSQSPEEQQRRQEEAVTLKQPPPTKYYNRCRFCKKWFQKTDICRVHEKACAPLHGYAAPQPPGPRDVSKRCRFCSASFVSKAGRAIHEHHCLRRERNIESTGLASSQTGGALQRELPLPPPPKYTQQCRFCHKYFQRLSQRRIHEVECGSRFGYTLRQVKAAQSAPASRPTNMRRCSICGKLLKTVGGRVRHEYYCQRSSDQTRSLTSTPTPASPATYRCRYCHVLFQSLPQCVSHELSCTEVPGCSDLPEANAASLSGGQDVFKCRYCGKGHLKWRSLMTHEFHCRRKVPPRADVVAVAGSEKVMGNPEVTVSGSGKSNRDENSGQVGTTASEDERQGPLNRCSYCNKWFRTRKLCEVHKYACSRNVRVSVRGRYKCSFCPRRLLKRSSCIMHERHCPCATDRMRDRAAANRAEVVDGRDQEQQRQSSATGCEQPLPCVESTERREVVSSCVLDPDQKRKKMDTQLHTRILDSAKETDIWACQYCDKTFKYRECLRTHEVKCSAIATYQYSMPHHRLPSFFKCPLCRKAFKLRRKLHNHWKVCKTRTSVKAEVAELNGNALPTRARSERSSGSDADLGVNISPGEDYEEWRGWPSSHSQSVIDLVTDEDSSSCVVESCALSCKLCKKQFCSRVLLELHTLNECVYQRIRNDHAYAQCESAGIDESTLMRMARVELQRLLLCSCCGNIFADRQALTEHELLERQRHDRMQTELENPPQYGSEATHLQKRIKLGNVVDNSDIELQGGQQESSSREEQMSTSDRVVPATFAKLQNAGSRQDSNKSCLPWNILCGSGNKQFMEKEPSEKQIKEVNIQQQDRQQLSMSIEPGSSNNSVLQECVRNNCNKEQLKVDPSNKLPNHTHMPQQRLENLKNRWSGQTYSEVNCRDDTTRENQCPKIIQNHTTMHCQGIKKGNLPQGLCNGVDHLSQHGNSTANVPYLLP